MVEVDLHALGSHDDPLKTIVGFIRQEGGNAGAFREVLRDGPKELLGFSVEVAGDDSGRLGARCAGAEVARGRHQPLGDLRGKAFLQATDIVLGLPEVFLELRRPLGELRDRRGEGIDQGVADLGLQPVVGERTVADFPDGAHVAADLLGPDELDDADLAGARTVHPAAGHAVRAFNLDDADPTLELRRAAQAEVRCLVAFGLEGRDRPVLAHHGICPLLGPFEVLGRNVGCGEVHGCVLLSLMDRDRLVVPDFEHDRRDDVLTGVLLHVIAAHCLVESAADAAADLESGAVPGCGVNEMQNPAVALLDVDDRHVGELPTVGGLAAALGVEAGAVELDPDASGGHGAALRSFGCHNVRVELGLIWIFVVQFFRHGRSIVKAMGRRKPVEAFAV